MFTGLITACHPLLASDPVAGGRRLRVANPYGTLNPGESIAVNGVCLTWRPFATIKGLGAWTFPSQPNSPATAS